MSHSLKNSIVYLLYGQSPHADELVYSVLSALHMLGGGSRDYRILEKFGDRLIYCDNDTFFLKHPRTDMSEKFSLAMRLYASVNIIFTILARASYPIPSWPRTSKTRRGSSMIIQEVAEFLQLSTRTGKRLVHNGPFPRLAAGSASPGEGLSRL